VGETLLVEVMRGGRRTAATPALNEVREYCRSQLEALPVAMRALQVQSGSEARSGEAQSAAVFKVNVSAALQQLAASTDAWLGS
jgi:hypothetical protein